MAAEDWITLEDAAEKLHVVLDTMRRWVRLGYFPRTKVGKRYLVPRKAVDEFLERGIEHGPRPVTPRKQKEPEPASPALQATPEVSKPEPAKQEQDRPRARARPIPPPPLEGTGTG